MNILTTILIHKKKEVAQAQSQASLWDVKARALDTPPPRGFAAAIRGSRAEGSPRHPKPAPAVIAEIKRASPSAGIIREDFNPAELAKSYQRGGASAISCLTDKKFFEGSLEIFGIARAATTLPMLRKEFMIDPYQVWEARAAGADAVLLIAGFVSWPELYRLRDAAREAKLDVLLEIHSKEELEAALELKPNVLGINNRNLRANDLTTNLDVTRGLIHKIPNKLTLISESGIRTAEDVMELGMLGVDGILVGEHLMREPDPGAAISEKLGVHTAGRI